MTTRIQTLRQRILEKPPLLLPGAGDATTALVIEKVGFEAIYISGAAISNVMLGLPEISGLQQEPLFP